MNTLVARIPALVLAAFACSAFAAGPDCAGVQRWASSMAFVHLKNAGLASNDKLDLAKTKTVRPASEKIGKNLHRQVHFVVFTEKSGGTIEIITTNDASNDECSMTGV